MKINSLKASMSYPTLNLSTHPITKTNSVRNSNQNLATVPTNFHRQMFETNQKLSNIAFKGIPEETKIVQLKKSLTKICEETINRYNTREESISQNLFTRSFIHHSFDYTEKEGHIFNNSKDPFCPGQWYSYFCCKNKTTVSGKSLCTVYSEKMKSKIDSWNQKFIQIITNEKDKGENNLLDELLESCDDVEKVKILLAIK